MERKTQIHVWYVILAIFGVLLLQSLWQQSQQVEVIPYSDFQQYLKDGRVAEVVVTENHIRGVLREPGKDGRKFFVTTRIDPDFAKELTQYGIKVTGASEKNFITEILSWILPMLLFFGIWMFFIRKMAEKGGIGGGLMTVGKSKAKVYMESDTKVGFDDVAGVDEAKAELQEVVAFLRNPETYGRLGARIPKGVLLVGPPGTGKTLLARAVAGEAGVPFFSISGSEFVEMFVGVGAARVRDLFEQARKKAPCIIFIDELDAIGRSRGAGPAMGGHDEREQTLNQLLTEMDGFDSSSGVVVMAATNRPEILDQALLRSGRFDRRIRVDKPDLETREGILRLYGGRMQLADDVDLRVIAQRTPGFVGADLENICNEAAIQAIRNDRDRVTMSDFEAAIDRVIAGPESRSHPLSPDEKHRVAVHEAGHTLVAVKVPTGEPVHRVTIIPRAIGALGFTLQLPVEEKYLSTVEEMKDQIAILLGGRVAEERVLGSISSGASNDLERATQIARMMVTRLGMSERLGPVVYGRVQELEFLQGQSVEERDYSDETARQIDDEVRALVEEGRQRAMEILERHREVHERLTQTLEEKETLDAEQIREIVGSDE